jgi:hypothetical protein
MTVQIADFSKGLKNDCPGKLYVFKVYQLKNKKDASIKYKKINPKKGPERGKEVKDQNFFKSKIK